MTDTTHQAAQVLTDEERAEIYGRWYGARGTCFNDLMIDIERATIAKLQAATPASDGPLSSERLVQEAWLSHGYARGTPHSSMFLHGARYAERHLKTTTPAEPSQPVELPDERAAFEALVATVDAGTSADYRALQEHCVMRNARAALASVKAPSHPSPDQAKKANH